MVLVVEYNSKTLTLDEDHHELLDIYEFIKIFQYPIEKLYIDKFWNGINNDEWIIVDYDMLRWMGYANARDTDKKKKYKHLLEDHFNEHIDYDTMSECDVRIGALKGPIKKNTIIVRAKIFKKSLMMLRTERASIIRDYYLMVEEILIDYMKYTHVVTIRNSQFELRAIEQEKAKDTQRIQLLEQQLANAQIQFDVDTTPILQNEYVYILTNKRHYSQYLFKIGKSINPKSRLISYNTASPIADEDMFYIAKIATCDCSSLEKLIHRLLSNFRHRKEWFHIPHHDLKTIINMISRDMTHWIDTIDSIIARGFSDVKPISLNDFDKSIENTEIETKVPVIQTNESKIAKTPDPVLDIHLEQEQPQRDNSVLTKYIELITLLPESWFSELSNIEKMIHAFRNAGHETSICIRTVNQILAQYSILEVDIEYLFRTPMSSKQKTITLFGIRKIIAELNPTEFNFWKIKYDKTTRAHRLVFKDGSFVPYNMAKEIFGKPKVKPDKLTKLDSRITIVRKDICKSCLKLFKVKCCRYHDLNNKSARMFIMNADIV
jgi:T5orf172 domain/MSV199 domain